MSYRNGDDVDDFDDDDDGYDDDDADVDDIDDVDGDAGDNGGWWNSGDSQCLPITVRGSRSEFSSFVLFIFVLCNFSYVFSATFHICSLQDKYIFKTSRLGQSSRAGVVNPFQQRKKV